MIRINLLPHREMRRERRKKDFVGTIAITAVAGAALAFAGGFVINQQIEAQSARNAFVKAAIAKLDIEIAEIKNLEQEIASLQARQKAVEDLQSDRTVPVHLFDELVKLMPEGVFLEKLDQLDLKVNMHGFAQSNERVAELLRNLGDDNEWLEKPQGSAAEGGSQGQGQRPGQRHPPRLRVQDERADQAAHARWPGRRPRRRAAAQRQRGLAGDGRGRHGECTMKNIEIDFSAITRQFEGLQGRHPGLWPALPRTLLLIGLLAALLFVGWLVYWRGLIEELEAGQQQEQQLRVEYQDKVKKAVNLDSLRRAKAQVEQYVGVLEKQLPSRAEMDALLTDINQAGVGRGAQLQLFKPGQVQVKDYYAELPITVKVVGNYHDLGAFSSDIANLPRIVTLNNLNIKRQPKTGLLEMDATAKTFRYLDRDEIEAQRVAKAAAAKGAKGARK
jgi:type IV pilus assembly protein PilO